MYVHLWPLGIGWGLALVLFAIWVYTGNRTAVPFVAALFVALVGTSWSIWRIARFRRLVEAADFQVCPRCAQHLTGYDQVERCPECGTAVDAEGLKAYWTEMFRHSD